MLLINHNLSILRGKFRVTLNPSNRIMIKLISNSTLNSLKLKFGHAK